MLDGSRDGTSGKSNASVAFMYSPAAAVLTLKGSTAAASYEMLSGILATVATLSFT